MKSGLLFVLAMAVAACGAPNEHPTTLSDAGLVDSASLTKQVIYVEDWYVYLKQCEKNAPLPLSRHCRGEIVSDMALSDYLAALPFDTGPYDRSDEGLEILTGMIARVQHDVDRGIDEARRRLRQLTNYRNDLIEVLKIRDEISSEDVRVTYLDYQDEFRQLLGPFGGGDILPTTLDEMLSWFDQGTPASESYMLQNQSYKHSLSFVATIPHRPARVRGAVQAFTAQGQVYVVGEDTIERGRQLVARGVYQPYDAARGESRYDHGSLCQGVFSFRVIRKFGREHLAFKMDLTVAGCQGNPQGLFAIGLIEAN